MNLKNNKVFYALMTIYAALLGGDIYSTLRMGDLAQHLEANPIYPYIGFGGIIALNVVVMALFMWGYLKSKNPTLRYVLVWGLVMINITRIVVIYYNYQVYLNPPTIEQAVAITQATKNSYQLRTIGYLNLVPWFQTLLTYAFWAPGHKIRVKQ